ncbi:hypothetical protein ACU4GD_35625 [Cupriavidus basilensis]
MQVLEGQLPGTESTRLAPGPLPGPGRNCRTDLPFGREVRQAGRYRPQGRR